MNKIFFFFVFLFVLARAAFCENQMSRIELNDGSIIHGVVISLNNGIYDIKSVSVGNLKIESSKVKKIESLNSSFPADPMQSRPNSVEPNIGPYKETKQKLLSDPETASIVTSLAADPQVQALAKDPQVAEAAKSGNFEALMKNENFMKLMNDPRVQEAAQKLEEKK